MFLSDVCRAMWWWRMRARRVTHTNCGYHGRWDTVYNHAAIMQGHSPVCPACRLPVAAWGVPHERYQRVLAQARRAHANRQIPLETSLSQPHDNA